MTPLEVRNRRFKCPSALHARGCGRKAFKQRFANATEGTAASHRFCSMCCVWIQRHPVCPVCVCPGSGTQHRKPAISKLSPWFISALSCLWGRWQGLLERSWEFCWGGFYGTRMHVSHYDGRPLVRRWAVVTASSSFPTPCIPNKMGRTMSVCVSWPQCWEDLVPCATAASSSQCQADLTNHSYTGDECLMSILLTGQGALTGEPGKSKED